MYKADFNAADQADRFIEYRRRLKENQNLRYRQRIFHKYNFHPPTNSIANSSIENNIDVHANDQHSHNETYQEKENAVVVPVDVEPMDAQSTDDDVELNEDSQSYVDPQSNEDSQPSEDGDHEDVFPNEEGDNTSEDHFLSQLVNFIHSANLNKTTTNSLLSLLRSKCSCNAGGIPKTIDALWKLLDIKFDFDTYYFCSMCFAELLKYDDVCPTCCSKGTVNSELCIFSLSNEIDRVVKSNIDLIRWYSIPENQLVADVVNGNRYKNNTSESCLSLMISTDGKPIVKSKNKQTSVWPILSFLVEIPPPVREHVNNTLLLGLWHSPVTPPCHLLLNRIVDNIKCLIATGINIVIKKKIMHFSIKIQLFSGDLPARAKVNQLSNHNGYYACSMCLFQGRRCLRPCGYHTLYRWVDFIQAPQKQRTQEHINICSKRLDHVNKNLFGVIGISPISSILSIPQQSTFDYFHLVLEVHFRYLLSEWYSMIKQNEKALKLIDQYLDGIKYPHTFNRKPGDFSKFNKWKASELRCFMIYIVLPLLFKLSLEVPNCVPNVLISHFLLLFIYIRTLRHFDKRDHIENMPPYIHVYLSYFSKLYNPCKELFSVHALIHLWQQAQEHGALAYHSLFAAESCLQIFEKLAHGSVILGHQMAYWWCIIRQLSSKHKQYSINLFNHHGIIYDNFIDLNLVKDYHQEFCLIFYETFSEFPNTSLRYHSRYQNSFILYHSLSYSRRQSSNSYTVCVNDKRNSLKSVIKYGECFFFFDMRNEPFMFFKRFTESKNLFSSFLKPIEYIPYWDIYINKYYQIVKHSSYELEIIPCSCIISKCISLKLDDDFSVFTPVEIETEHD
ncbi:unnamed protein product [Rotaria magnacalcarata]|uniref:Uncharacterized protein n=1 Tax=Rotaria magnacalcarata TaxID=392030 RepID=A0A816M603_9BILA|nr:unnamed protein product [Rotaria magnacalcarata]CAF1609416.1 unnamed protein product [Rotaria magnacalcarata]CAF1991670.1 unnamed protein product [Rotaria magnacalcarata]CAF2132326.1 unnamed protein product [Rotaria magnacalcarata]CAF2152078.1 unnamed protein product [Rotaria magnacalcarata]